MLDVTQPQNIRTSTGRSLQILCPFESPLESGKRAFDGPVIHAVGDAEMAGAQETAPGNHQDVFFLQQPHETNIIGNGTSGEQIEGTRRIDEIIADASQAGNQKIPLMPVNGDVHTDSLEPADESLLKSRRVDEAENTISQRESAEQRLEIGGLRVDGYEPEPFSW